MRPRRDIVVGVTTSIISMVVGLAVIPLYIRYLGIEAYGLIGFMAVLQGIVQLLDLGFTPTISREIARARELGEIGAARALLHSFAIIVWAMGAAIGLAVWMLSEPIATNWLNADMLSPPVIVGAVAQMGIVVALRWPVGIYSGALIGDRKLTLVSLLNLATLLVSSLGVILVLEWWEASIAAFFTWQILVSATQVLVFRHLVWRSLGSGGRIRFSLAPLKHVWRFSAGMTGVAVSAMVLTQLDRVLVSKFAPLEEFAYYAIGAMAGRALYGFINPIYHVIYPRFCALVAADALDELSRSYRVWTTAFCSLFFPATMALAVGAMPLVQLWTANAELAARVAPIVTILAIASGLHGVMFFPYSLQVASGNTRLPFGINIALTLVYVPLAVILVGSIGAMGAAWSWLAVIAFYLVFGTWMTHRHFLRGTGLEWMFKDVGIPLLISAACGFAYMLCLEALDAFDAEPLLKAAVGGCWLLVALAASIVVAAFRYVELKAEFHRALRMGRI